MAQRTSLKTVSHNISNTENPNYVRQSAIHKNSRYQDYGGVYLQVGTGADIKVIRQTRDEFLDIRYRGETATYGYHKLKSDVLQEIEGIFREKSEHSIQGVMETFWEKAAELAKNPEALTIRGLLHETGVAVADTFNSVAHQLEMSKRNLNTRIYDHIERINEIIDRVKEINTMIKGQEAADPKYSMNDIRDERNALLDELSELCPIDIQGNNVGEALVYLQGRLIVGSDFVNHIIPTSDNKGYFHPHFESDKQLVELGGFGALAGILDVRDKSIPEYEERLDIYVKHFAHNVNKIHRFGYGLDNSTGLQFFTCNLGTDDNLITAANIKVNPALANLNKIAASSQLDKENKVMVGDGKVIERIVNLRNTIEDKPIIYEKYNDPSVTITVRPFYRDYNKLKELKEEFFKPEARLTYNIETGMHEATDPINDFKTGKDQAQYEARYKEIFGDDTELKNGMSIDAFYNDIIFRVGVERRESIDIMDAQYKLMTNLNEKRKEISGVSLDEEMSEMMRFQHAYSANSRILNAVDEMMDQIVNRLGLVGR